MRSLNCGTFIVRTKSENMYYTRYINIQRVSVLWLYSPPTRPIQAWGRDEPQVKCIPAKSIPSEQGRGLCNSVVERYTFGRLFRSGGPPCHICFNQITDVTLGPGCNKVDSNTKDQHRLQRSRNMKKIHKNRTVERRFKGIVYYPHRWCRSFAAVGHPQSPVVCPFPTVGQSWSFAAVGRSPPPRGRRWSHFPLGLF